MNATGVISSYDIAIFICDLPFFHICHLESFPIVYKSQTFLFLWDTMFVSGEKSIRLPLMWMAPESIFTGKYDEKSEVFSLALAIMELYSDGVHPYQEMDQASSAKKKISTVSYGIRLCEISH